MSNKVVVTGGGGFIGSHLTERLLDRGSHVVVFENRGSLNLQSASNHSRLTVVEGDIRDAEAVEGVIGPDVDCVFHLAAVVGVKNYMTDPLSVIDINVGGTSNVLRAAARVGARVLLTSTSEVYGKNPEVPWSEDDDRVLGSTSIDRWSYSTSKATAEHMAFAMHHTEDLPVTIVRYFNTYGPRQSPHYVISQSVYRALRGEAPILYDGGQQTRCFTFIDDAMAGTLAAADHADAIGQVFNIGSSTETTVREAVETVLAVVGVDRGWEPLDTATHYGDAYEDITRRIPDVDKARRILGWEATTTLVEGVEATVDWARRNGWWLA